VSKSLIHNSRRLFGVKLMAVAAAMGFSRGISANAIRDGEISSEFLERFASLPSPQQEFVICAAIADAALAEERKRRPEVKWPR
jgi:hypothetical protein